MEKEDLVIGNAYISNGVLKNVAILEGFDKDGDPVLKPIMGGSGYALYNVLNVKEDPKVKIGCYGHSLEVFLARYKPYSE